MAGPYPSAKTSWGNVPVLEGGKASFEACHLPAKLSKGWKCSPGSWETCLRWVCGSFVAQVNAAGSG